MEVHAARVVETQVLVAIQDEPEWALAPLWSITGIM